MDCADCAWVQIRVSGRSAGSVERRECRQRQMKGCDFDVIVLGVILLLIGLLTGLGLLSAVGTVLVLVGAILWIMGAVGHQVGGRPHYY
jgi:hypothetical protein